MYETQSGIQASPQDAVDPRVEAEEEVGASGSLQQVATLTSELEGVEEVVHGGEQEHYIKQKGADLSEEAGRDQQDQAGRGE